MKKYKNQYYRYFASRSILWNEGFSRLVIIMFVNRSRLLAAINAIVHVGKIPPPPRIGPVLPGSSAADELIELINGYIQNLIFCKY